MSDLEAALRLDIGLDPDAGGGREAFDEVSAFEALHAGTVPSPLRAMEYSNPAAVRRTPITVS